MVHTRSRTKPCANLHCQKLFCCKRLRCIELLATSLGIFFIKEINGIHKIALYNTQNNQITVFESNAKPNSQLNKDKDENVYFINSSGIVSYLPKSNSGYSNVMSLPYQNNPNSKFQTSSPNFSINPKTDVIYYTGSSQDLFQLYPVANDQWLSVNILGNSWNSNPKVTGYITYNSPHPFFISNGTIGNYFFIPQANCTNIKEREGLLTSEIGLSVLPNPVDYLLQVNSLETEKINYAIRNLNGSIVMTGELNPGDYIEVSNLIVGSYLVEINQNGKRVIEKIAILR